MSGADVAIKVFHLSKHYNLYKAPLDRIKEALNPLKKKYHRKFNALNDVSFEIGKGEVVGIIGRNGSGKSTLLKLISSVLTPSDGHVAVEGKISAILELGAGFNPELTGMENIYLNMSISGLSREEIDAKVSEVIDFAELGEHIDQPIKTYSSGMGARLGFAVAINVNPDVLIVDEALSVGDAAFQRKCFAKIDNIKKSGATVIFVSHSDSSIVNLCDRAIWLDNGTKMLDGVPKLVTGLYLKNIEKVGLSHEDIESEYLALLEREESADHVEEVVKHQIVANSLEAFNQALQSKSMISYAENGASIKNIMMTTLDGREVNTIVQGCEYIYRYRVELDDHVQEVLCAMLIKNTQGVNIGGGHYPKRDSYQKVDLRTFDVKWRWKCHLLEGEYFVNCGVSDKTGFLHRIIDSFMFKVVNNDYGLQSYHMVDFIQAVEYE